MPVTFDIPADIEQTLRREFGDLSQAAKEAALVELFRQHHLTHADLSRALALSRMEVEELLKRHHVMEDLPTEAEYAAALSQLRAAMLE